MLFFFSFQGRELSSVLYAGVVTVVLYLYLMHYVTEETQRVARLGIACIVFTVAMQASPLAVVVCKMNAFF